MLHLLFVAGLLLGSDLHAAPLDCDGALLDRAAALELNLLSVAESAPEEARAAAGRLSLRLESYVSGGLESSAPLARLEAELDRLKVFVEQSENVGDMPLLEPYEQWPQLLQAESFYITRRGLKVRFSAELWSEVLKNRRLAMQVIRALAQNSLRRMVYDALVVEVRLRSQEFGGYRLYGVYRQGELYLREMVPDHMRQSAVNRALQRLSPHQ